MKKIVGLLLMFVGIVLGLYVGGWIFFVGGIVDVVRVVRADTLDEAALAWGVAKIALSGFIGFLSGLIPFVLGEMLFED